MEKDSHCLQCKERTGNKDIKIFENKMHSNCVKCGRGKFTRIKKESTLPRVREQRFIVKPDGVFIKQKGGAALDVELSSQSYKKPGERSKNVKGYVLDTKLSNKKTAVYNNPKEEKTIIAHRGTVLSDKNDIKNDVKIAVGTLGSSKRVKNAKEIAKKAEKKYEGEIQHTGHSLGGATAIQVAKATGQKAVVYNPGVGPVDVLRRKKNEKIESHTTGFDPISGLSPLVYNTQIHKPKSLNVHTLSNFSQEGGLYKVHKK